ncbi:hypothetical protein EYF80_029057 [Liparis tanakae]|uniref:Uncharacterized protein n=1 Tax=Liparis tanakae TaxID=230148 RepID=A0A4Z2H6R9_9TELE|nr:hypothetical protein EYF80_029057 [Liparis tanakae]
MGLTQTLQAPCAVTLAHWKLQLPPRDTAESQPSAPLTDDFLCGYVMEFRASPALAAPGRWPLCSHQDTRGQGIGL